jgi:hypothetical protein
MQSGSPLCDRGTTRLREWGHMDPEAPQEPAELRVHSFIVKIWLETASEGPARFVGRWHGYITEVSGEGKRYFSDLDEIADFISSRLNIARRATPGNHGDHNHGKRR